MTVAEKSFQMSLGVTMDQSIPAEVLPTDRLAQVLNARVRKAGELSKRYSYTTRARTRVDTGGNITAGKRFIQRETELAMTDGHELFSYIPTLAKWAKRDRIPEAQVLEHRTVIEDQQGIGLHEATVASTAGVSDYGCVIVRDRTGSPNFALYARVFSLQTGALLDETTLTTVNAGFAKVIAVGSTFVAVWKENGTNNIKAAAFQTLTSSPAWTAASTLRNDANALANFDVCVGPSNTFILVYYTTGASLDAYRYDTAFAQQNVTTGLRAGKTITNIVCQATSGASPADVLFIAFGNSTDATVEVMGRVPTTLALSFAVASISANPSGLARALTIGSATTAAVWIAWDLLPSSATPFTNQGGVKYARVDNLGTISSVLTTYNVAVASRIWLYDSHSYMCVYTAQPGGDSGSVTDFVQKAVVVVDLGNAELTAGDTSYRMRPVARWGEGDINEGNYSFSPSAVVSGYVAGTYLVAYTWQDVDSVPGQGRGGRVKVTTINLDDTAAPRWVGQRQIGRDTLIPAGLLHAYDGKRCFEAGFTFYPIIVEVLAQAGGSLTANTYEYVAVYVYTDLAGRKWRSAPSLPKSGTTAGANLTLRVRIPHYSLTSMTDSSAGFRGPPGVEIYRRTSSDQSYTRVSTTGAGAITSCDPQSSTYIAFDDGAATNTDNQPTLYTDGGVLENITPPPCRYTCIWDNRVWLIGCDDPEVTFFSSELVDGEGARFDLDLNVRIDDGKGLVAATVQDASLVLLKGDNDGIFHLQGQGPDDTGLNSAYTEPQKIMTSVGCVDPRSVLTGNDGTFFQSRRGIEVLGRQLGAGIFGKNVQDLVGAATAITSACFEPNAGEYRFTAPAGNVGQVLAYTQDTACWAFDQLYGGASNNADQKLVDAMVLDGNYYALGANGHVWRETLGAYDGDIKDGSFVWVGAGFATGDIAINGPLGQLRAFRVALLGRRAGTHGLQAVGFLDQGVTTAFSKTFSSAEVSAFKWLPVELPEFNMVVQQGRVIRIIVQDTSDGGGEVSTAGPIWYHLLLEYGTEPQPLPVPTSNRK